MPPYLVSNPDSVVYHLELNLTENHNAINDDFEVCSLYGLRGTKGIMIIFQ